MYIYIHIIMLSKDILYIHYYIIRRPIYIIRLLHVQIYKRYKDKYIYIYICFCYLCPLMCEYIVFIAFMCLAFGFVAGRFAAGADVTGDNIDWEGCSVAKERIFCTQTLFFLFNSAYQC